MSNPTPETVDTALKRIEIASTHPRHLAKDAIARHRKREPLRLTQQIIDSGYDEEERRKMFISRALKFRRRTLFSRLFG